MDKIPRAICCREPSWHRKERQSRSTARKVIAKFIKRPRLRKANRILELVQRLESHHSAPRLLRARAALDNLGMSWQGGGWRGGYWKGAGKRSPQGKKSQDKKSQQDKDPKGTIPQYDADCWAGGSSASSSKGDAQAGNLQDLTKLLKTVVQAGKIELPPEALAILDASSKEESRASFSAEQKALNVRRKAFNRVQRLKEAMAKKTEKYKSFRQALKDQLATESERYEKDMADLKENLAKAEQDLEKIEAGEVEMPTAAPEEAVEELDIFDAMDIIKEKDRLKMKLEQSEASSKEMEAKYLETQKSLQQQLQMMQQQMQIMAGQNTSMPPGLHGPAWPISPVSSQELPTGSPQMPNSRVGPFNRARTRTREREGPYAKDSKEDPITSKCAIEAKQDGTGMDRME